MTQNYLTTPPPNAALPLAYTIDTIPASPDWIYELRWNDARLDTFYSIGDAVDEAQLAVIDDRLFDCVSGDMHVLTPAEQWEAEEGVIGALSLAMLDTCLGAPHSDAEAGCLLVELEERGIYVTPKHCAFCGRTHLKAGW